MKEYNNSCAYIKDFDTKKNNALSKLLINGSIKENARTTALKNKI